VVLTGGEWREWQVANRRVTTPHALHWLEADGSVDNLRLVGPNRLPGHQRRGPLFTDSDIYKFLEGVGWDLGLGESPELQAITDELVGVLAGRAGRRRLPELVRPSGLRETLGQPRQRP